MRRLLALLVVVAALGVSAARAADKPPYLAGRLLVAAESLLDPNFSHTVVYMVEHDAGGAVGLIVNRALGAGKLAHLLKGFGLDAPDDGREIRVHFGGPVAAGNVYILHSPDFTGAGTLKAEGGLSMTADKSILEALAAGGGPARMKVM
ncbi:MAG: YqgE/AlgH family protein, partial [Rhodospirillaceae bacterium]